MGRLSRFYDSLAPPCANAKRGSLQRWRAAPAFALPRLPHLHLAGWPPRLMTARLASALTSCLLSNNKQCTPLLGDTWGGREGGHTSIPHRHDLGHGSDMAGQEHAHAGSIYKPCPLAFTPLPLKLPCLYGTYLLMCCCTHTCPLSAATPGVHATSWLAAILLCQPTSFSYSQHSYTMEEALISTLALTYLCARLRTARATRW